MARLPYLDLADLAPEDRTLVRDINLSRIMMYSPDAARRQGALARYIRHESRLDPRLRELAILQVGYVARAPYEWAHHVRIARDFGVADAEIRAIAEESAGRETSLDPLARTVLRAAREMARGPGMAADTFAQLKEALGAERLVDLVVATAFYVATCRLLASFAMDVEDEYRPHLAEFPLPTE